MNKTSSVLKNVNFWGLVISNFIIIFIFILIIDYKFIMNNKKFPIEDALFLSTPALFVYLTFLKKINFAEKTVQKLFFYSFIFCIIIFYIWIAIIFLVGCFQRGPSIALLVTLLVFSPFIFFITTPYWLLITLVNFFWLLRERRQSN
jgi:hypothetical protein